MQKNLGYRYFRHIMLVLTILTLVLYIPYAILLYNTSEKSIFNNIQDSNQNLFGQLEKNYDYYSDTIKQISSGMFWQPDVQTLLYSPTASVTDYQSVATNIVLPIIYSNPNIHSVSIYNAAKNEIFTFNSSLDFNVDKFMEDISNTPDISVLEPVVNKLEYNVKGTLLEENIVSYFMFQFSGPSDDSFLVMNLYADSLLSSVGAQDGSTTDLSTFLVGNNQIIAAEVVSPEKAQAHEQLLNSFLDKMDGLNTSGYYVDEIDKVQYIMSYAKLGNSANSFVIIQNYDDVFAEISALSKSFVIIFIIMSALAVVLVIVIARYLYRPIAKTYAFFTKQADKYNISSSNKANELEVITDIFNMASQELQNVSSKASILRPHAVEHNLQRLLLNSDAKSIEHFKKTLPLYWISNNDNYFKVLLIRPVAIDRTIAISEVDDLLMYAVSNLSEELLSDEFHTASFRQSPDVLVIVISGKDEGGEINEQQLLDICDEVTKTIRKHFRFATTIAISETCDGRLELSAAYEEAMIALSYEYLLGFTVITPEQYALNENNTLNSYNSDLDKRLAIAIKQHNLSEIKVVVAEIMANISTFNCNNALVHSSTLLINLHRSIVQHSLEESSQHDLAFNNAFKRLANERYIKDAFAAIYDYLEQFYSEEETVTSSSDEMFVGMVMEFIHQNYTDPNLTSSMIADSMSISSRYLAKKFKSLTDTTLTDYIVSFRLKQAVNLLENTNESVNAIAEKVGIDNASYFYKLFKKAYGCTPREFIDRRDAK